MTQFQEIKSLVIEGKISTHLRKESSEIEILSTIRGEIPGNEDTEINTWKFRVLSIGKLDLLLEKWKKVYLF